MGHTHKHDSWDLALADTDSQLLTQQLAPSDSHIQESHGRESVGSELNRHGNGSQRG